MKRAVKKKIAKIVREERVLISEEHVQKIVQFLHKHYSTHPYLDGDRTKEEVRIQCIQEV